MGFGAKRKRFRRRMMKRAKKQWRDRHHLVPRSRGGTSEPSNILRIKRFRHEAWHALFDLPGGRPRTIEEIITLLLRLRRIKLRERA
jgi:hypothetical protein